MALTDTECKKSQPRDKQYRLSDSNGLSLRIDPNGNWTATTFLIANRNINMLLSSTEGGVRISLIFGTVQFKPDSLMKL
jgi:hypothetical protein